MTGQELRQILLIEDSAGDARLLREMLDEEGLRDVEETPRPLAGVGSGSPESESLSWLP